MQSAYPIGYCRNMKEFMFYQTYLEEQGLLKLEKGGNSSCLTTAGWQYINGDTDRENADQCFVAMWFDKSMNSAFEQGMQPLEETIGYRVVRIDSTHFNDKICHRIMAEIRRSKFLIVDVTGDRNAVFFEAGYAMGLGIPIIWCCRADRIGDDANVDTRQYNHILWDNPEDLLSKLKDRIAATIGPLEYDRPCNS